MRTASFVFAATYSFILVTNAAALADEPAFPPAKEFFPQPTEREARLEASLDQSSPINFNETSLADVAAWFSSKLETPVIIDDRSLSDAGITAATPVTRRADGITARAALKLVLDDLDLAVVSKNGVTIIMTMDKAESELITRVYPVGELTPLVPATPPGASRAMRGGIGSQKSAVGAASEKVAAPEPEKPAAPADTAAAVPTRMVPDYDALIEVITTTVRPQTWDEVGGPGSISAMLTANSIVVSQTREVHDEILELLRALRDAKRASESIEHK